jgi:hypothetical protein
MKHIKTKSIDSIQIGDDDNTYEEKMDTKRNTLQRRKREHIYHHTHHHCTANQIEGLVLESPTKAREDL